MAERSRDPKGTMLNTVSRDFCAQKIYGERQSVASEGGHFPKTDVADETKLWEITVRENVAFTNILQRFFRAFSSVVRQMSGYNSQRRGTARTSQIS